MAFKFDTMTLEEFVTIYNKQKATRKEYNKKRWSKMKEMLAEAKKRKLVK